MGDGRIMRFSQDNCLGDEPFALQYLNRYDIVQQKKVDADTIFISDKCVECLVSASLS